jgi:hypothetical protein
LLEQSEDSAPSERAFHDRRLEGGSTYVESESAPRHIPSALRITRTDDRHS